MTVNVRDGSTAALRASADESDGASGDADCGASRRTTCPTAVAIRPELARDGLGHDHDARLRRAFRLREAAPAHDLDAEHIEVVGRHGQLVDRHSAPPSPARRTRRVRRLARASAATTRPLPPPTDGPSAPGAARRAVVRSRSRPSPCRSSACRDLSSRRRRRLAEKWRRRSGGEPMRRPGRRSGHAVRGPDARPSSLRRASSAPARGGWPAAPARARRTPSTRWRQPPGTPAPASPGRERQGSTDSQTGRNPAVVWRSPHRAHPPETAARRPDRMPPPRAQEGGSP